MALPRRAAPACRSGPLPLALALAVLALPSLAAAADAAGACPLTYSGHEAVPGGLLLGGVLSSNVTCKTAAGGACPRLATSERGGYWCGAAQPAALHLPRPPRRPPPRPASAAPALSAS